MMQRDHKSPHIQTIDCESLYLLFAVNVVPLHDKTFRFLRRLRYQYFSSTRNSKNSVQINKQIKQILIQPAAVKLKNYNGFANTTKRFLKCQITVFNFKLLFDKIFIKVSLILNT